MNISDVFQSAIASYDDWDGFLINPRYFRNNNELSWQNRIPGTLNSVVRRSDVLKMAAAGQYTFQISEDASLIQLYYRFDQHSRMLAGARLAFYNAYQESIDEEAQLAEYGVVPTDTHEVDDLGDTVSRSISDPPVGWMRIDYDPNPTERGIIHHDCHLHISAMPDARFVVSGVPSPRQFVEFVISSAFPEKYKKHRLVSVVSDVGDSEVWNYKYPQRINTLNQECMPIEGSVYDQLSHFRIPVGSGV